MAIVHLQSTNWFVKNKKEFLELVNFVCGVKNVQFINMKHSSLFFSVLTFHMM